MSANIVWARADWDLGVDCSDGLFTIERIKSNVSAKLCCVCAPLQKNVSINFGTSHFDKNSGKRFDRGLMNKVNLLSLDLVAYH